MVKKTPILLFVLIVLELSIVGCKSKREDSDKINATPRLTPMEKLFPPPYFPVHDTTILGIPVDRISPTWKSACVYSQEYFNQEQQAFYQTLAEGDTNGEWGTSFSRDFDSDGFQETVCYGAFERNDGTIRNFLLIVKNKNGKNEVTLVNEYPYEYVMFACFFLKDDMSMVFGDGLIGSELSWELTWENGKPVLADIRE